MISPLDSPPWHASYEWYDNLQHAMRLWINNFELLCQKHLPYEEALRDLWLDSPGWKEACQRMWWTWMTDPSLWQGWSKEWMDHALAIQENVELCFKGDKEGPLYQDKRFRDPAWWEQAWSHAIAQLYTMTCRMLQERIDRLTHLSPTTQGLLRFFSRQWCDAFAPSNSIFLNPEIWRTTIEEKGANWVRGMEHMLADVQSAGWSGMPSLVDHYAFSVGKDLAATPGVVAFKNELVELLWYRPRTTHQSKVPLLIVPPCINKYYILDLQAHNSLVGFLLDQGHPLCMISWRNPDHGDTELGFEDYLRLGPLAALGWMRDFFGAESVDCLGYCLGGTLLACCLAYLAAHGKDWVRSASFMTTMLDFQHPGELGALTQCGLIETMEHGWKRMGYCDGRLMSATFGMLRSQDFLWTAMVNHYLLGKKRSAMDFLYWNADHTRLPAAMHRFYLQAMYCDNALIVPGALQLLDTPIDLGRIAIPCYMVGAIEDHIVPWQATYASACALGGSVTYRLAGSGHIAGMINPPSQKKYGYWTGPSPSPSLPAEEWKASAVKQEGSWWTDWAAWLQALPYQEQPSLHPEDRGMADYPAAPGDYVHG